MNPGVRIETSGRSAGLPRIPVRRMFDRGPG